MLDSSFNPPTKAHLALALSTSQAKESITTDGNGGDDARLLLLSVRNADKALKAGDATHVQRLDMMVLLAKEIESRSSQSSTPGKSQMMMEGEDGNTHEDVDEGANVAVAIIDEPTFVRKSAVLRDFLNARIATFPLFSSQSSPKEA